MNESHVDLEWLKEQAEERRVGRQQPLSKREIRKRDLLASQLAKHFGPRETVGPCACNAPDCFDVGCSQFWGYVMRINRGSIKKMIKVHLIYREGR